MAQPTNEEIIQQLTNSITPDQSTNGAAVATPPPTETSDVAVAKAKLAFAKNNSKQNVDTAKAVLKVKKALGIDPRVETLTNHMDIVDAHDVNAYAPADKPPASTFNNVRTGTGPTEIPPGEKEWDRNAYTNLVMPAEGGAEGSNAKSKTSSATGSFQFIKKTWLDLMKKHPELGLTYPTKANPKAIDGRKDPEQARKAHEAFMDDNIKILKKNNFSINNTNMYIMHTLGSGNGPKILRLARDGETKEASTFLSKIIPLKNKSWFKNKPTPQGLVDHLSKHLQQYAPADPPTGTYVVQKGDTLSLIAKRNNISLEKLKEYNPWTKKDPDSIVEGQELFFEKPIDFEEEDYQFGDGSVADSGVSQESATPIEPDPGDALEDTSLSREEQDALARKAQYEQDLKKDSVTPSEEPTPAVEAPVSTNELDTGPVDQGPQNLNASLDSVTANIPTPVAVDEPTPEVEVEDEEEKLKSIRAGIEGTDEFGAEDTYATPAPETSAVEPVVEEPIEKTEQKLTHLKEHKTPSKQEVDVFNKIGEFGNDLRTKVDALIDYSEKVVDFGADAIKEGASAVTKEVLEDIQIAKDLSKKLVKAKDDFLAAGSKETTQPGVSAAGAELAKVFEEAKAKKDALNEKAVTGTPVARAAAFEQAQTQAEETAKAEALAQKEIEEKGTPFQQYLEGYAKEQAIKKQTAPKTFSQRVAETNVHPYFKKKIAEIARMPSFVNKSPVIHVNGNVISHGDGTYSAVLGNKVISGFATEADAAYHAVSHAANLRIQKQGGYEQWSFGDLKNQLMGSLAQPVEAGARAVLMGDPTLNGKVLEYNALKGSQALLNDPKTDISEKDLANYRLVRDSKVLTPELEAWKKEAESLMHYDESKFAALSRLDKEAKANVQLSKDIDEYGNKWREFWPENDSGWQGAQAAFDLIAANKGDWAAVKDIFARHKADYAKKGLSSAAYSVALVAGSPAAGIPALTAFALDEIRKGKLEWIEKNGEENYTQDVETRIELAFAAKVITQKISLGYLNKTIGSVIPGGRKMWIQKAIESITANTPKSVQLLGFLAKKPAGLVMGAGGEGVQGALEEKLHQVGLGEEQDTGKIAQAGAGELFGTATLGPLFATKNVTKKVYDFAKSPSAKKQAVEQLTNEKTKLETKLKKIEDQEKSVNPKDVANLESLQKDVMDIEEALAALPNASIDKWGEGSKPLISTNNPTLQKLFKEYESLINDTDFTIQDAIEAMQKDLQDQLSTKQPELEAFKKRIPKPPIPEPTLKEKLSMDHVSDTFSDQQKDTRIKVGDTAYGEKLKEKLEEVEEKIKKVEASEDSETKKIIGLNVLHEEQNKIATQLNEAANADLLKAEKQVLQGQIKKKDAQLKVEGLKPESKTKIVETIKEVVNKQINEKVGDKISDEEVNKVLSEIKTERPDTSDWTTTYEPIPGDEVAGEPILMEEVTIAHEEFIPLDEETHFGKGDIVDLKNTDNEEIDSSQGYIIQEVLPRQADGNIHVRLKGIDETVPVDQLIERVRPDANPRTTLEKLQALLQRDMSDEAKKLVQAKFDELVKNYAPKDDGKGGKTFGSIEDSEEEHDKLSIDETKKKLKQYNADPDASAEDKLYWQKQVDRKIEKAKRAEKEEQAEKTMADVHEEILEGDTKKWKGLAKYHEEIINSYKNLTDPVLRDRHIRALTSKMITHATNLNSKLAQFKRAKGMIPNLASGMGAVVVGSIDEKSPRGVRKMNYKTVSMPLTEADAKAQAKANGVEYKEGSSFEARKDNGQFVTLISDKTHKFANFTINKSDGLINNLEGEVKYGKLIMGTVQGYKKTSMAQAAANQEIKIKAKQNVYDTLVKLRGGMPRVVEEVTDEQREDIKIDEAVDETSTLENQLKEAKTKLKTTVDTFNELGEDDENKKSLRDKIDELKTTIAGLESRIAESKVDEPAGDDTRTEDKAPEESAKSPDESTPDVRETTKDEEGKPGEQIEFSFAGKNFIESATLIYQTAIKAVSKDNLDKALGLIGKKFTDLVNIGKRVKEGGIHTLSDADIETPKALTKALINLGLDSKSAKILSNRYTKFAKRFRETLYHSIVKGNTVVLLDRDENAKEPVKYGGAQLKVISIKGDKAEVQGPGVEGGNTFTVELADLQDTTNYAIRQPLSLLYREDTKNPDNQQGILPNQVIFSMMVGAMTWRQRTADNNVFGDSDYKMEAFLYNNTQKLSQNEKTELGKLGYSYNDVARQIGYDISQMLHLSPTKASGELTQEGIDIYYEHLIPALGMAAIETAQGNDSEAYFIKDVHKWAFDEANAPGRVYNNNVKGSKADKDGFGYRQLKVNEKRPPSEEGLAAVKDLTTTLNLDIQSNAGPLQNPRDIRTDVPGTFGEVPQEVQRLMKKLHKVEWSKSQPMDIVSDLFEDHSDVLEQVMGIEELYERDADGEYIYVLDKDGERKVDKNGEPIKKGRWHEYDMESKAASNRDKLASLKRLVEANDRNELDKFYFTYSLQNHHRIMQEGKINPQGSKVDRFLLKSWEPKTYNEKNLWKFELAVAQNFGSDIDKQTYGDSKTYFNDLVNNSNVLAAVHAYQKLTKARDLVESTKLKKANKTKHKNALVAKKAAAKEFADALSIVKSSEDTGGGNMSLLQGIAGLAQYMTVSPSKSAKLGFRKTINKSFESDIVMEIDGISNGFAMNVMQFPMWKNMPEMLAKIATYFGDDTEHDTKAPDTYQTLAEYVQEAMGDGTLNLESKSNKIAIDFINKNRWKDDYSEFSLYKENKWNYHVKKKDKGNEKIEKKAAENLLSDYNKLNAALNTIYPDFTQDAGALRSVVKYPFIIHMYGGGIDRISKDVTKDIISELYSQVGVMQQTYNSMRASSAQAEAFFQEYRFTEVGEQLEGEAAGISQELRSYAKQMSDFVNALEALGAFRQENRGTKPVVTKAQFIESMKKGESLNKYFNDNYLRANISTTIAPRFNHGLKTMLAPTQEARDTIVQMGGVLHGTFMVHFKRAYDTKLKEVGRSSLTKHELTKLIKDTKGELIKVFPQYKGPISSIDENGNTEGFIDLSKTENVSVLNDKIGVPENVDKMSSKELINFVEENVDDLTENAKTRLIKIINFKKDIPEEIQLDLVSSLQGRDKLADERIEYRTANQDKNGKYDSNTSQTHNTFPQQLRFIEPGVSALIRQIINMDSVLLTQTMNGDSNINVNGKRWIGDLNVLMLHDAFMASPEQLSTISAAYGQLFLHYNRTHSVIEQTYDQVQKVLGITSQIDNSAPEGLPSLEEELMDWVKNEFFDNKNKSDDDKIGYQELIEGFAKVKDEVLEARRQLEKLASENGGLNESLQMFMQKPEGQSQDQVLREGMLAAAEESVNNRERSPVAKKEIAETFTRTYEEHQTSFDFFTEEDKQELKSLLADKGEIHETKDLGDITRNKVKTLFNDFVELSGNYYNNAEEEASHTDSLNRVLDILSKGFDSTAGIQLTYEQIEGITQGTYSEAQERITISASRNAPRIRNGQSPQEVYTHELLHGMTSIAIDQSPLVRQRIERLYSNVETTLELTYGKGQGYKVFLPPGTGPTRLATAAEIVMAKKQYHHAFHAKEEARLHEFMAYANTNASLSNFMKSNSIAQRTGLYGRMLDMIKNIVDTVREVLGQRVYKPENALQLSEAIAITEQLVAIQNKHKSKAEQIQSKTYKALDASDQIIRNFANKAYKRYARAVVKSTEEGKPSFESADPGLKIATGLIAIPYIYFGEDNGITEARNHWMEKMNYSMRGLLKEFGDGVLNEKMIEQLLQSKGNISKQRQLAETFQIDWFNGNKRDGIKSIWKSLDPTKRHAMSVETREALTNVMLRSDISQLITAGLDLNSPAGMKKIIGLIGKDKNSIRARKQLQLDILRRLGVTADSAAIQYADELGYWQMTGLTERLADARSNAYSIALDYLSNPTEERVGLLDAYATISALGHIDTQDAHLIKDLAKNEFKADSQQNGIISIMQAHINFKAKSRKDLFDGDPTQMMKGYVVERMDNLTDIQIGTPEQKEEFEERGYTESVKLSKIATNQTHYIMYINRNKPEVKDVSGIMSTTNTRNQGTTLTEILSLNDDYQIGDTGKPDMPVIRAKIKQFKKHQNDLAKKLGFDDRFKFRPLFDQNNKIVDYRIMMNHEDTKNIIKPDLEFQNVFAHMHSNLVDRKNTIINDKETVHLLVHEQENLYKTYPKQFINILDPESAYHERYLKLPRPVREYIQEFAVNGEFMVRIDIVDKVFGYKQKDITQAKVFENNKHPLAEQVAGLTHYAIKETVGYGKNRVVLAIPKVIFLNMMSNVTQLMMRKIPPSYIFNKLIEGLSEYKRYSKDALEMRKLQYEIDTKKLPDNSAEAQQVKRLKVRIEGNKIHKMNEAGVDSLIIEDLNAAQLDGYWNRMSRLLFKGELKNVGDKIPRSVQTVAHTLFWTKESIPYQYSKQVVQMTDFMGRYVMMEHSQNVLGKSFKESLHEALEAFVLFDESLIAPLEMLDALGATSFLSYWLRNQRAVKRLVTTNPSSVAISAVMQELTGVPTLGNVNSAWMGGDFSPNVFQTDDLFDEANNITLFEVLSDLKNF